MVKWVDFATGLARPMWKRSLLLASLAQAFYSGGRHYRRGKRVERWRRARTDVFQSYLYSQAVSKLQIGTGTNILPGWLNTDLEPTDARVAFLDLREPLPFKNGTFDYIFSEHCIEHVSYMEGLSALAECRRVLKPGGRIRLATPNLNAFVSLCSTPKSELQERYIKWSTDTNCPQVGYYAAGFVVNNIFRLWGHQFIYDPDTLGAALGRAGFSDVKWFAPGESGDRNLRALEGHGRVIGEEMNHLETMVAEATRPPTDPGSARQGDEQPRSEVAC